MPASRAWYSTFIVSGSSEFPSISFKSSGERTAKRKWNRGSSHHSSARWNLSSRDMPASNANFWLVISPASIRSIRMWRMRSRFSSLSATMRGSSPDG